MEDIKAGHQPRFEISRLCLKPKDCTRKMLLNIATLQFRKRFLEMYDDTKLIQFLKSL